MAKKQIATFLAPNKGLSTLGNHSYAYSGLKASDGTNETTYLEFTTGDYYCVGIMSFDYAGEENTTFTPRIYFNNSNIAEPTTKYGDAEPIKPVDVHILLSPRTVIKSTCQLGSAGNCAVRFTGRVYDA